MSVRANWHLEDILRAPREMTDPMEAGAPIDTTQDEASLHQELSTLAAKEARMDQYADVACEVKWEEGHFLMGGTSKSCETCPLFVNSPAERRSAICRLGRQQEEVVRLINATRAHGSLDAELAAAYEADIDMYGELAAAHAA